jgi:hypothetical protein
MYRCEATSVAGFVQQLAVAYVRNGYWFYVQGTIPKRKSPDKQLQKENKALRGQLQDALAENAILRQKIDALAQRIFGKKSEQLDANQLEMLLSGMESQAKAPEKEEDSDEEPAL